MASSCKYGTGSCKVAKSRVQVSRRSVVSRIRQENGNVKRNCVRSAGCRTSCKEESGVAAGGCRCGCSRDRAGHFAGGGRADLRWDADEMRCRCLRPGCFARFGGPGPVQFGRCVLGVSGQRLATGCLLTAAWLLLLLNPLGPDDGDGDASAAVFV